MHKNVLKIILWVIGFIGFAGVATFWNVIWKPWINFSVSTVRYDSNQYQEVIFHNTSEDINLQAEIEIPISKDEKVKKQVETSSVFSDGRYIVSDSKITIFLGKDQDVNFTCMNCHIDTSSIKNLSPNNFSLKECFAKDSDCIRHNKFYEFLSIIMRWWLLVILGGYLLLSLYAKSLDQAEVKT